MPDGARFGTVVDLMLHCDRQDLAYAVLSFDGIGGLGEQLRLVAADRLELRVDGLHTTWTEQQLRTLPPIDATDWPLMPDPTRNRPLQPPL
ncbi:MAG: PRC-barrel domain-containing protein [Novosphingobium sp.]